MTDLRVMSYNILDGGRNREASLLQVIESSTPDVVILQEVFTEDFLGYLSQSLGMRYFIGGGNKKRRVALLSRFPLRSFKSHHPVFPVWRNFIDAEIEYKPNKTMRVIGVHPIANLGMIFEVWRFFEAHYVIKHSQQFRNDFCLIAGDFNAIAPNDQITTNTMPKWLRWTIRLQGNRVYRFSIRAFLSAHFVDCFRSINPDDDGFSLPTPSPNARLDYIFASAKMAECLKKCWVVREPDATKWASDHYPVMAAFDL